MIETKKGFTQEQLRELPSFKEVEAATEELAAINGRTLDPNDRESLEQGVKDLERREQLDLFMAHQAFRIALVQAGEDFLPLISRLSLLAGFDPKRMKAQNDAHTEDEAALERMKTQEPWLYNQYVGLIAIGSRPHADRAHPLASARKIEGALLGIQSQLEASTPGPIGMEYNGSFFVGQAADPSVLVLEEPQLIRNDDGIAITYEIPTRLHGITDVKRRVPYGESDFDPSQFGDLFTVVDGQPVAHPSLGEVLSALSTRWSYRTRQSPFFGETAIAAAGHNINFEQTHQKGYRRRRSRL